MASHYYIKYVGVNPTGKHIYDVLLKEEVDYGKHNIVFVAEDSQWIGFIHKYKATHYGTVMEHGREKRVPIHPLNDNIPPEKLKKMYNGEIEF